MNVTIDIAKSICQHRTEEELIGKRNIGVARADCATSNAMVASNDYMENK